MQGLPCNAAAAPCPSAFRASSTKATYNASGFSSSGSSWDAHGANAAMATCPADATAAPGASASCSTYNVTATAASVSYNTYKATAAARVFSSCCNAAPTTWPADAAAAAYALAASAFSSCCNAAPATCPADAAAAAAYAWAASACSRSCKAADDTIQAQAAHAGNAGASARRARRRSLPGTPPKLAAWVGTALLTNWNLQLDALQGGRLLLAVNYQAFWEVGFQQHPVLTLPRLCPLNFLPPQPLPVPSTTVRLPAEVQTWAQSLNQTVLEVSFGLGALWSAHQTLVQALQRGCASGPV